MVSTGPSVIERGGGDDGSVVVVGQWRYRRERERERRGGDSGCVPVTPLEDAPDAFPFDERGNRTAVPRCHGHRPSSIPNVSPTA